MLKFKIIISIICIVLLINLGFFIYNNPYLFLTKSAELDSFEPIQKEGITIVATMNDKISADSAWCGTFQLAWNDLKNNISKDDIISSSKPELINNLNNSFFNESMISKDHYYKISDIKTPELKSKIEKAINDKFNQTSDVLDSLDFNFGQNEYLIYAMLYKDFKFPEKFSMIDPGSFGIEYDNIKYFGVNSNSNEAIRKQLKVLYYNSKEDFAILIKTKTNDEIILCKNPTGDTFDKIYKNILYKASKYNGKKSFQDIDKFKAPYITFDEKKIYEELKNIHVKISNSNYEYATIQDAIQTINFSLDEVGGKIKSEAVISVGFGINTTPKKENEPVPRYFYVDDTFALFLKEKWCSSPYFAMRASDITKFQ